MSLKVTAPVEPVETFDLMPLRFRFTALDPIAFPQAGSANLLRGSFGRVLKRLACAPECSDARQCPQRFTCAYGRFFEPAMLPGSGPSGLADWPRPFVFRSAQLDEATVRAGGQFEFGVNVFDLRSSAMEILKEVFSAMANEGFGPRRARARLDSAESGMALCLPLRAEGTTISKIRVRFVTPTELKGTDRPEFGVLFARIRDRVSTLRSLYGAGPLAIDFKAMGLRAATVKMTRCECNVVAAERKSGRTGQRHSIGGFTGVAEYSGDLAEFVPYLDIARWTGVGRQTVWGKGEIAYECFEGEPA